MSDYLTVRLNEATETTQAEATESLRWVIDEGSYFTTNDSPPAFEAGNPIAGIGSHGGAGLFIHGIIASSEWEPAHGPRYQHRIKVTWDANIYEGDRDETLEGVHYGTRGWSEISREEYGLILSRLLAPAAA